MTGRPCSVSKAMDQLTERERQEMQSIMENGIASHIIAVWFKQERGIDGVSAAAITSHRRGLCACGEET